VAVAPVAPEIRLLLASAMGTAINWETVAELVTLTQTILQLLADSRYRRLSGTDLLTRTTDL